MTIEKQYLARLKEIKQKDIEVLLKKSYRGIWETAIKKYSDSAHFIYELLQNADDAKATLVEFTLEEEGLWFKHNGTVRFTISDPDNEEADSENGKLGHINSITSIGNTTKIDIDEQKIGKFGIGFKAVFAYSLIPQIFDDTFNFSLENYIVPNEIAANTQRRKQGETLFYLPFNHMAKTKEDAYKEIEEKLDSLFQPILFLTNLQKIKWVSSKKNGVYSKNILKSETFENVQANLLEVVNIENGVSQKEHIWVFSSDLVNSNHRISVGFFVLNESELETGFKYEAFCFFPTKEETKLSFIVHAPFLLTDSREGIKAGEQWNVDLIQLVADLAATSIVILKEIGIREKSFLINDSILDLIPYNESEFSEITNKSKISFKPFYNSILVAFKKYQLLPGRNGKYYGPSKAFWAADPELAELFTDEQISKLMANPNSGWVFISKGQKQLNQANKPLESYINSIVVESIDAKKLLRRITSEFIEEQTDEWLLTFYAYLGGRKFLWDDKDKLVLKRPILLNQDRKAVVPFDGALTTPNIFLPTDRNTSYDTIYKFFTEDEEALDFFKSLGIGKPDLRAEIFKTIIPQYNNSFDLDDIDTLLLHFDSFLSYYEVCPANMQFEFINKLQEISFVAARSLSDPEKLYFCKPSQVYFRNENLISYFENTTEVFFLDEDFYIDYSNGNKKTKFINFLTTLGLYSIPRVLDVKPKVTTEIKELFALDSLLISYTNTYQIVTDRHLDGLTDVVNSISLSMSVILWNYLLNHVQGKTISQAKDYFLGTFNYTPRSYSYSRIARFESTTVSILKYDEWLFDREENLTSSKNLTKETLNSVYNVEDDYAGVLLEFLGIENPDANLNLTEEQKQALNLGRKFMDEGITHEQIEEILNMLAARKRAAESQQNEDSEDENSSYEEEIDAMLSKLKKGIKKKRQADAKTDTNSDTSIDTKQSKLELEEPIEPMSDVDDYSKPSIDIQKKINKLKEQAQAQIEDLTRIEKLNEIANTSEIYTYAWFMALLELEYMNSSETNSQGKEVSLQFTKVEKEEGTERTLILKHPNRYIPRSIEDIGDLQIILYQGDESRSVTVEVVSVKEYTLRAKLKKSADISDIDLNKVSRVVINLKNPVFIIEELRKAFHQLDFEDDYNLQKNLTKKIRFVFGPPGTGKTTFLATDEIIPRMQEKEDLKILVLAPTNKAADVLTKCIIKKMGEDESYNDWLLRFGTISDAELESSSLMVNKSFDIRTKPRNTTITTIARFAYDYFQPDSTVERLHLKFLQWDYIIFDEASMITVANIAYVLYQRPEANFIIAGDPFQIQPITQIAQWKDMNIYNMVRLDKFVDPVTVPHQYEIKNLKKQYRSIPTIGNVFSHFTYNGILEHHRSLADQKPLNIEGLDFKDINIIKFPVSKYESIFKPNALNKSHFQVYSALFTVEFVQHLAKQIENSHKDKFRIGVICPYKNQATIIEKVLEQSYSKGDKTEILVGTIHGFQGDECDIIVSIFNPPFSISKSPKMFLNKQNILNVSISRARDYLFVIMPDDKTEDIENLYKIRQIERLIHRHANTRLTVYDSEIIEEIMFGSKTFVFDNSFATSHQSVNVYSKLDGRKYEVRCEDTAVDVQIQD